MDIGTLRGLGTLLIMVAFIGLVIWAYSGKRKKSFDEATMLPFADDPEALSGSSCQRNHWRCWAYDSECAPGCSHTRGMGICRKLMPLEHNR